MTHGLILSFILFQVVALVVLVSNILILHRHHRHTAPAVWPKLSILIPARNEENNIGRCVASLLGQDYPDYEILVLDDQSVDRTLSILQNLEKETSHLTVLSGKPLPPGWLGKSWACAQLSQVAQGDLFLFTDADTVFQPTAARSIVATMLGVQADLLTGYPKQVMQTWGEKILVPFFSWTTLCFFPLRLAYSLPWPALAHAVGQMMCFRRAAYLAVNGHTDIKDSIIEDIQFARKIKRLGLRWRVMQVRDFISCRMYTNGREAYHGLVKNLFSVFNFRLVPFAFAYVWLIMMFCEPLVVLILWSSGHAPAARGIELGLCIGLSFLLWMVASIELGYPPEVPFIYPISILAIGLAAFQSARLTISKRLRWKDRNLPTPQWKWL